MEWDILNAVKAGLTILFTWILLSSLSACGVQAGGIRMGTTDYWKQYNEREVRRLEHETVRGQYGRRKNHTK